MAQKNKDDRFAFSASGSFQCSRDGERLALIAAILGLFLLLALNVLVFILQILQMFNDAGIFWALRSIIVINLPWVVVLLLISAAEVFLFRVVRTRIFRGDTYFYFADETFFTIRCPKRRINFSVRYEDVVSVTYTERRALWYPRGYTAAIVTADEKMLVFRCITYEKTASLKRVLKIPAAFRLLEERVEEMRRAHGKELSETIDWEEYEQ